MFVIWKTDPIKHREYRTQADGVLSHGKIESFKILLEQWLSKGCEMKASLVWLTSASSDVRSDTPNMQNRGKKESAFGITKKNFIPIEESF